MCLQNTMPSTYKVTTVDATSLSSMPEVVKMNVSHNSTLASHAVFTNLGFEREVSLFDFHWS